MTAIQVDRTAVVSADGLYRYSLTRTWDGLLDVPSAGTATFIMLNPSKADASRDDPTVRRCIRFAHTWGHRGLLVLNLYAYRATDPRDLWTADDPIGPGNDSALRELLSGQRWGDVVVAAWGANARPDRVDQVVAICSEVGATLHCLATNADGSPAHPLYQPKDAAPRLWRKP